jgi:hypothetical protein
MSKTFRKTPAHSKHFIWIYPSPKKQNYININIDDDKIHTKNYKEKTVYDKTSSYVNYYKIENIVKTYVNKKFIDFEQCLKNNGLYSEVHKYVNFKSQIIFSILCK